MNEDPAVGIREPFILIGKSSRTLDLFDGDRLVKRYTIALGFSPEGNKETEGDGRTPEGEFYIFVKNPKSKFRLSLGISYPSREAADRGLKDGRITEGEYNEISEAIVELKMPPQKSALGGEIYIHGGGSTSDWTDGCVALSDEDIAELFEAVPAGARVRILP